VRPENLLKKRLIPAFAMILGWTITALAVTPAPLTTLRAIHVGQSQAAHNLPVDFEATVVYFRGYENLLLFRTTIAASLSGPGESQPPARDRIRIEGVTRQSFRPLVIGNAVTLLRHGSLPVPVPATYDDLIAPSATLFSSVYRPKSARRTSWYRTGAVQSTRLQLTTDGGHFEVYLDNDNLNAVTSLLDAEVKVDGVAAGKFDDKMQQTGVVLYVSSLSNISRSPPCRDNPWSLSVTPMDRILSVYHVRELTSGSGSRINHLHQPGRRLCCRTGQKPVDLDA